MFSFGMFSSGMFSFGMFSFDIFSFDMFSFDMFQDVFALVPSAEIRALREESPSNLATLCYKAVEKLVAAADASCRTQRDHLQVRPARVFSQAISHDPACAL